MKKESRRRIGEAFRVIERYHRSLIDRMATDVLEHRDDFENPFLGGAEALVEKYYHLFSCVCAVSAELSAFLPSERKNPPASCEKPLGKDEFRCFRCRSIIDPGGDACPKCGWTWG